MRIYNNVTSKDWKGIKKLAKTKYRDEKGVNYTVSKKAMELVQQIADADSFTIAAREAICDTYTDDAPKMDWQSNFAIAPSFYPSSLFHRCNFEERAVMDPLDMSFCPTGLMVQHLKFCDTDDITLSTELSEDSGFVHVNMTVPKNYRQFFYSKDGSVATFKKQKVAIIDR